MTGAARRKAGCPVGPALINGLDRRSVPSPHAMPNYNARFALSLVSVLFLSTGGCSSGSPPSASGEGPSATSGTPQPSGGDAAPSGGDATAPSGAAAAAASGADAAQASDGGPNDLSDASSTGVAPDTGPDAVGPMTADYGFRPQTDGFQFPNYADFDGENVFGTAELRRMFGDDVCASLSGGVCTLSPQGQDWADNVNAALQTGHCEGFAVLSLLFFNKCIDPTTFGASVTSQLTLTGNGLHKEVVR